MDIISTRQVADLLAVSEATVKRWADAGTIRCFRTPGGHRKFRLNDVAEFLRSNKYEPAGPLAPEVPPTLPNVPANEKQAIPVNRLEDPNAVERFRNLALAGDADALVSLTAQLRLRGLTLSSIFDSVVTPAMTEIGDRWERGQITVSQEHIASAAVVDALARTRPLIDRNKADRGQVVCACPGDEQHDIALRLASLLAYGAGFTPVFVSGRTPVSDLALLVTAERPVALVLSATYVTSPEQLSQDLARMAEVCRAVGTFVFAGGQAIDRLPSIPMGIQHVHTLTELLMALLRLG